MSTFLDLYIPKVGKELRILEGDNKRRLTVEEIYEAKRLYIQGWHPRRIAERIYKSAKEFKINPLGEEYK